MACASLALGGHGVLEGTLCGEMVSGTDTTLDLHLLELLGLLVLLCGGLLGGARLVADLGSEDNVLAEGGGVGLGTGGAASLEAHLGPGATLSDARLLVFSLDDGADALCALDLLALVVQEDGDDGLAAILVLCVLGCGKGGGEIGLVVLGPVSTAWCVGHGGWCGEVVKVREAGVIALCSSLSLLLPRCRCREKFSESVDAARAFQAPIRSFSPMLLFTKTSTLTLHISLKS